MRWAIFILLWGCAHTVPEPAPLLIYVPYYSPRWQECRGWCSDHHVDSPLRDGVPGADCAAVVQSEFGTQFICKPYDA